MTVTVGRPSGTDVRVDKSTLTFTTQNWNQPQDGEGDGGTRQRRGQ